MKLNRWYNWIGLYFFLISFTEIYDSNCVSKIALYHQTVIPIVLTNLIKSGIMASSCAIIALFCCYKSEWIYIHTPNCAKTPLLDNKDEIDKIINGGFISAFLFFLLKFIYFWLANHGLGPFNTPTMLIASFYFILFFIAIFINVTLVRLDKLEEKSPFVKLKLETNSQAFILGLYNQMHVLIIYTLVLILGANFVSIIFNYGTLGGEPELHVSLLFIIALFLIALAYIHLIYFRALHVGLILSKNFKLLDDEENEKRLLEARKALKDLRE